MVYDVWSINQNEASMFLRENKIEKNKYYAPQGILFTTSGPKKKSEMPSSPFSSAIRNSAPTFGVWLNMRNVLCSIRALCTTFRDITRKQRSKATSKRRKNIKQRIIYVITIRRSATLLQVHVDDHLVAFFFSRKKSVKRFSGMLFFLSTPRVAWSQEINYTFGACSP